MSRRETFDVAFYVPWIGGLLANEEGRSTGGAETQVFLVARALASRGLRVCLLAFDVPGTTIPSEVDGVSVRVRPPYRSKQPLVGKLREAWNIGAAISSVSAATIVTRAAGPHVGLVGLASKLQGRRFVYASASPIDFDVDRVAPKRRDRVLLRLGYRLADVIVVQTREQIESCLRGTRRRPTIIPSMSEAAEPGSPERGAFLWIGRLVSYKQPLAFTELARRVPEARFEMVAAEVPFAAGAAELTAAVEQAAEELPNLTLIRPMPRARLMTLVSRATAIVSTSSFEGMPNVFLEGWARGIPSLVYEYDPDGVVERNELGLVAGGSLDALAEQTRRLWTDSAERERLSQSARDYVRRVHAPDVVSNAWTAVVRPDTSSDIESLAVREA